MKKIGITARVNMILTFWFLLSLLLFLCFGGMTKSFFYLDSRQANLTAHASGHITKVEDDTTSRPRRVVGKMYDYAYTYNAKSYDGNVNGLLPQMYTNDQTVDVLLDPENPSVSKLPYTTNVTIPPWISLGITVAVLIIFLGVCIGIEGRIKLLRKGVCVKSNFFTARWNEEKQVWRGNIVAVALKVLALLFILSMQLDFWTKTSW
jgi:hypothetical protein